MSAPPAERQPLTRAKFARPTDELARSLLGIWLLRETDDGLCGGPIVETEAYGGPEDRASHARAGRTRRTEPMYGPVGHAYVYLVYGMHECLNVVGYDGADARAGAGAVLIRAIEPRVGIEHMRSRRGRPRDRDTRLCAGPARLCQALGVDRSFDGHDLTAGAGLWLEQVPSSVQGLEIASGARVGVAYAGDGWATRPWRYWLAGHPSVSRP